MLPFMMLPLVSGERLGEVEERPSLRLKPVLNWWGREALLRCSTPGLRISHCTSPPPAPPSTRNINQLRAKQFNTTWVS